MEIPYNRGLKGILSVSVLVLVLQGTFGLPLFEKAVSPLRAMNEPSLSFAQTGQGGTVMPRTSE
jgi:hypothetical protein